MKIIFDKAGKYKNGNKTLVIENKNVIDENVYDVETKNAENYVRVKKAHPAGSKAIKEKKEPEKKNK